MREDYRREDIIVFQLADTWRDSMTADIVKLETN